MSRTGAESVALGPWLASNRQGVKTSLEWHVSSRERAKALELLSELRPQCQAIAILVGESTEYPPSRKAQVGDIQAAAAASAQEVTILNASTIRDQAADAGRVARGDSWGRLPRLRAHENPAQGMGFRAPDLSGVPEIPRVDLGAWGV